jgi:hypothetical protein
MVPAGAHLLHARRKTCACGGSIGEHGHGRQSDVEAWHVRKDTTLSIAGRAKASA